MGEFEHILFAVLFVISGGVMAWLFYFLHRRFKYFRTWKDEFSRVLSKDFEREKQIAKTFRAETRNDIEFAKTWFKKELEHFNVEIQKAHVDCRKEVLAGIKRVNGTTHVQTEEALKLQGRLNVKHAKIDALTKSIDELQNRLGRLEYDIDKILLGKNN